MKYSLGLAFALAIAASSAAAQDAPASKNAPVAHHHRHHHTARPAATRPVPAAQSGTLGPIRPPIGPYLHGPYPHTGDGDNDGLSRDPDDCNKGCIDGNPG
jgi:hypothetical protein